MEDRLMGAQGDRLVPYRPVLRILALADERDGDKAPPAECWKLVGKVDRGVGLRCVDPVATSRSEVFERSCRLLAS